jgi:hypothetical protein
MLLTQNNNRERGSVTIESALIFTVVFICIFCILNAATYLYLRSCVQSIADDAILKGANYYKNINYTSEGLLKKKDMNKGTYWRIINDKQKVYEKVSEYILLKIQRNKLNYFINTEILLDVSNYGLYNEFQVKIRCSYHTNIMNIFEPFEITSKSIIESKSELLVNKDLNFITW